VQPAYGDLRLGFLDGNELAMTEFPRTVRERVEAQGFLGLEDGIIGDEKRARETVCLTRPHIDPRSVSPEAAW
jgi:hypothetical protein